MDAYAVPLPVFVIRELLGLPASDRHTFSRWSSALVDDTGSAGIMEAATQLREYLAELVEAKRTESDDALIAALSGDAEQLAGPFTDVRCGMLAL